MYAGKTAYLQAPTYTVPPCLGIHPDLVILPSFEIAISNIPGTLYFPLLPSVHPWGPPLEP